jgi:NADH-quinone oxidoreductase subunit N
MSSALLWIILPFLVGAVLFITSGYRKVTYFAGMTTAILLTFGARFLAIDQPIGLGSAGIKISSSMDVLGRKLVISQNELTIVLLLYAISAFWLIGAFVLRSSSILPPVTLVMTSMLCASLAVEPFLYAAVLIEAAVLVSLLLFPLIPGRKDPGIVRYLIFQTLGFPFMLFTGWFLGGLQTGSADPQDVRLALIFLGIGFGFVLAIFPFYSWIPKLTGEEDPYLVGFILIMLPTAALFSLLAYVDQYSWLRESVELPRIFQTAGVMMIVTGGIFSGFQRNIARMFGYAVIVENGFSVLAIGLMTARGYELFANLLLSRLFSFGLWTLCLAFLLKNYPNLELKSLYGAGRRFPLILAGLLTAQFGMAGLPMLAGFPLRIALMEELALQSPHLAWLLIIGLAGLWVGAIYSFWVFIQGADTVGPLWIKTRMLNALIVIGVVILVWLGLTPQLYTEFMNKLLLPYIHLLPL